jgi:hypothetical protein
MGGASDALLVELRLEDAAREQREVSLKGNPLHQQLIYLV